MYRKLFSTLQQVHLIPNDLYERVMWYWLFISFAQLYWYSQSNFVRGQKIQSLCEQKNANRNYQIYQKYAKIWPAFILNLWTILFIFFFLFFFYLFVCFCRHKCNNVINFFSLTLYEKTVRSCFCIAMFFYNSYFILLNVFCKFADMYIFVVEKNLVSQKNI